MMLPFTDRLMVSSVGDGECAELFDRHYSRQTVGARRFASNGRSLVLRDAEGLVLFLWMFPEARYRWDHQEGFNCAIFRNESQRQSSEIILEAEQMAIEKWGPHRMYTYIDPSKIKSANPGYCFKVAGWRLEKIIPSGKHLLVKP